MMMMMMIDMQGYKYNAHEYGWYRWIFTCEEEADMKLALEGFERALRERKAKRSHETISK